MYEIQKRLGRRKEGRGEGAGGLREAFAVDVCWTFQLIQLCFQKRQPQKKLSSCSCEEYQLTLKTRNRNPAGLQFRGENLMANQNTNNIIITIIIIIIIIIYTDGRDG